MDRNREGIAMGADRPLLAQFGAGKIGRSLVGQLFTRAGWDVVFLDVDEAVVDALNARRGYRIEIRDDGLPEGEPVVVEVRNVSGISVRDRDAALGCLARADLAGTSVGAANLPDVCALLAEALPLRDRTLPVMLCENLHGAGKAARRYVGERFADRAAFVEAAISKMAPLTPEALRQKDPLLTLAEAYNTLYLDAEAYPGVPPVVPGVAWRGDFGAYVERKLYLNNFGHAVAAYHGFLAGKTAIHECMEDRAVRGEVAACMMEAARGLAARHARVFTFDENRAWMDDLLRRFGNRALGDTVFRVGRDLRRKYARDDRMLGTLRMLRDENAGYRRTARAVAAGLFFAAADESGGREAGDAEIVGMARERGVREVLVGVGKLDPVEDAALIDAVSAEYAALASKHSVLKD